MPKLGSLAFRVTYTYGIDLSEALWLPVAPGLQSCPPFSMQVMLSGLYCKLYYLEI